MERIFLPWIRAAAFILWYADKTSPYPLLRHRVCPRGAAPAFHGCASLPFPFANLPCGSGSGGILPYVGFIHVWDKRICADGKERLS